MFHHYLNLHDMSYPVWYVRIVQKKCGSDNLMKNKYHPVSANSLATNSAIVSMDSSTVRARF